jgi:hypothetical protein
MAAPAAAAKAAAAKARLTSQTRSRRAEFEPAENAVETWYRTKLDTASRLRSMIARHERDY